MNVIKAIDSFVVKSVRTPDCKPDRSFVTMRSPRSLILGSQLFMTVILKLTETPTVNSIQPVKGTIVGASEQVGSGMT